MGASRSIRCCAQCTGHSQAHAETASLNPVHLIIYQPLNSIVVRDRYPRQALWCYPSRPRALPCAYGSGPARNLLRFHRLASSSRDAHENPNLSGPHDHAFGLDYA
mmetsp:Transcript_13897/g.22957  ORF Transcript_13897/g.22957 Transcript_13897/m.22957 type:complete len:106 (-) Transcript_13897:965-1282(-)